MSSHTQSSSYHGYVDVEHWGQRAVLVREGQWVGDLVGDDWWWPVTGVRGWEGERERWSCASFLFHAMTVEDVPLATVAKFWRRGWLGVSLQCSEESRKRWEKRALPLHCSSSSFSWWPENPSPTIFMPDLVTMRRNATPLGCLWSVGHA